MHSLTVSLEKSSFRRTVHTPFDLTSEDCGSSALCSSEGETSYCISLSLSQSFSTTKGFFLHVVCPHVQPLAGCVA